MGFARNLILFLFEREREGYKRFADCTVERLTNKLLCAPTHWTLHIGRLTDKLLYTPADWTLYIGRLINKLLCTPADRLESVYRKVNRQIIQHSS